MTNSISRLRHFNVDTADFKDALDELGQIIVACESDINSLQAIVSHSKQGQVLEGTEMGLEIKAYTRMLASDFLLDFTFSNNSLSVKIYHAGLFDTNGSALPPIKYSSALADALIQLSQTIYAYSMASAITVEDVAQIGFSIIPSSVLETCSDILSELIGCFDLEEFSQLSQMATRCGSNVFDLLPNPILNFNFIRENRAVLLDILKQQIAQSPNDLVFQKTLLDLTQDTTDLSCLDDLLIDQNGCISVKAKNSLLSALHRENFISYFETSDLIDRLTKLGATTYLQLQLLKQHPRFLSHFLITQGFLARSRKFELLLCRGGVDVDDELIYIKPKK